MTSRVQYKLVRAAEQLYATQLRSQLEPAHDGEFIAIEPESREYFLGKSLSAAIQAARRAHPTRLPYARRVGTETGEPFGNVMIPIDRRRKTSNNASMSTDTPTTAKHDLDEAVARLMKGVRDPEAGRKAREDMDRMREETRQRIGTVDAAVDLIREVRDR